MNTIKRPIEASKELEIFNFKTLLPDNSMLPISKKAINERPDGNVKNWMLNNKLSPEPANVKKRYVETQLAVFQRAMKVLMICGQCIGLNPIGGVIGKDVRKMKFTFISLRFLYSTVIGTAQAIATILSVYRLLNTNISIRGLAFISFYLSTSCASFIFQRIALKWPNLLKEISHSGLDEYIDPKITMKCNIACAIFLTCGLLEHILSIQAAIVAILDCSIDEISPYEKYIRTSFPWLYELPITYYLPFGVVLQILNIISTINWNYTDLFIVCISMYLTSILEQINKKIEQAHDNKYLPSTFWRSLREDYNRATRLVRSFDDIMSATIFASFASNLFFICLQLFSVLSNGVKPKHASIEQCPYHPSGPFRGYEYAVYLVFSLSYLLGRSLAVSLIAAGVNSASMVPAPALYNIPPSMYCEEVQRFLDQIHGDTVALSGLQFFHVTRELVLSVAGTIVTYELVLLQFSSDELKK